VSEGSLLSVNANSWTSYPKIFALGHRAIRDLTSGPVIIEEKVDGSQFSFGKFNGVLRVKSKNVEFDIDVPVDMFKVACEKVKELAPVLVDGWTYRGEAFCKPKHNVLAYDRMPRGGIILFDVNTSHEEYLGYGDKVQEASRLGLEVVPMLYAGVVTEKVLRDLLKHTSILGGQTIEGVVLKPGQYSLFGDDKKVLLGKFVSEAFKELHKNDPNWVKTSGPSMVEKFIDELKTTARWNKAVQHLRERGELQNAPQDIPNILREVHRDVLEEEGDRIKDRLFKHYWKDISKGITGGLPEWWKLSLMQEQFESAGEGRVVS
jgi:hypothetical protein